MFGSAASDQTLSVVFVRILLHERVQIDGDCHRDVPRPRDHFANLVANPMRLHSFFR